nr:IS630 family transposase [Orientia tsutsugamushi]
MNSSPDKAVYFFDESRFGTKSKLGYGWFPKGIRTVVPVKLGFQNFYVYSAVNAIVGDNFSLIVPRVNTVLMNVFLREMFQYLGETQAIIVMDCAGWHKSKDLVVPDNIEIIYLPPYSPELNPTERWWQYLKRHTLKNKVYDTLDMLEDMVCEFIRNCDMQTLRQICSLNY